jgi:hypothetical protein
MHDFNSNDSVKAWLDASGGVEGLQNAISTGRIAGQKKVQAEAWLDAHKREAAAQDAVEVRALSKRAVEAAEASAVAAQESANWAKWAVVAALVASIVAAIPYLNIG